MSIGSWEEWALSLATTDIEHGRDLVTAADPSDARDQRITRIEAEIKRLQAELRDLPERSDLLRSAERYRGLLTTARSSGLAVAPRIRSPSAASLTALLSAYADGSVERLPPWCRPTDTAALLASEASQTELLQLLEWLKQTFPSGVPPALSELPEEANGDSTLVRLQTGWQRHTHLREVFAVLPVHLHAQVRNCSPRVRDGLPQWVAAWRVVLSAPALVGLVQSALANNSLQPRSSVISTMATDALDLLRAQADWQLASKVIDLTGRASTVPATAQSGQPVAAGSPVLDFSHVMTDDAGHIIAAPLILPELPATQDHGHVEIPVRIVASAPLAETTDVGLFGPLLEYLPADMVSSGDVSVQVRDSERFLLWSIPVTDRWVRLDDRRWSVEFAIRLPMTRRQRDDIAGGKERFSVRISDGRTSAQLTFDRVERKMPPLGGRSRLDEATDTDIVREYPLGVQLHHEKLEAAVEGGRQPFMVVAPRRFGKSTLFRHLAEHARGSGHTVIEVSLSRSMTSIDAISQVWEEVQNALHRRFGSAPRLGERAPSRLFDAAAWLAVRRFLKQHAASTLVLLIDEAQAMVPRSGGVAWGDEFKNFLEGTLTRIDPELARVQIGLCGTVDLSVRLGSNCRDFLLMHGVEVHAFDEPSLARYLRLSAQGNLVSTRNARLELTRWANNLRTLKIVFDEVQRRLVSRRRVFVIDGDVRSVVDEILMSDAHAREQVWSYARSELSHRDEWDPTDALPVALAWARTENTQGSRATRLEACTEWLNGRLRKNVAAGVIARDRVEAGVRELMTRGVLREDGTFWRPLVRELLHRNETLLEDDQAAVLALLRLAVDAIDWPSEAEPRDAGGQATVYVARQGERAMAYRMCDLASEDDRRRFARTCTAIRALRDKTSHGEGDNHLPLVRLAGFRADDTTKGVLVYDWIDGEPLSHLWENLPDDALAYVVGQVALACAALHRRGVIHCDITPRNVIVDGRLKASLIDFGLARTMDTLAVTRLPSERFKAPEQVTDIPAVSTKSDVWALGQLLTGTGRRYPDGLAELVARAALPIPDERPNAHDLARSIIEQVPFEPRIAAAESAVEDVIVEAPDYLWEELFHHQRSAALARGGYLKWNRTRAYQTSFMLNQLFVQATLSAPGARLFPVKDEISLAIAGNHVRGTKEDERSWKSPAVKAIGALRNGWAHPSSREKHLERAMSLLSATDGTSTEAFADAARSVARLIDSLTGATGAPVERFVTLFISASAPP